LGLEVSAGWASPPSRGLWVWRHSATPPPASPPASLEAETLALAPSPQGLTVVAHTLMRRRKLEIAERTLPENIKTRLKHCSEARLGRLKELDVRAVRDEAQIGIDQGNYTKFVVEQEEEQNRQDIQEEELGLAVQAAAKSVTEMHTIHRLQRAEWDNERLPALVDKVRECSAA
jgi:hypothetical protein